MDTGIVNLSGEIPLRFSRWNSLASMYCRDRTVIGNLFGELKTAYNEPHRFYHNTGHIESLLLLSEQYADKIKERNVVDFSIYYHDIVYLPGKEDNEYQSALAAGKALLSLGVSQEVIVAVQHFINITKTHELPATANTDLAFFIDFDLAILAADREAYKMYCSRVRREFANMSKTHFAWGRTVFLRNMLKQQHLFYTKEFQANEEQARQNIQWEIEHLRHI